MHDVNILDSITPEPGSFYVMDRGYIDFERLHVLHDLGAFFVTRTKQGVLLRRRYSHPVDATTGLRSDHTVVLASALSRKHYPDALRRIHFYDAEQDRRLRFLTNNFALPALTICLLYKSRWQVELFFESLTWCTPSDVYGISRIIWAESAVGGVTGCFRASTHRSTSVLRSIQGALTQACVAGNSFN